MSTQNEWELFREYATNEGWNTSPEQNNCGIVVPDRFKHPKVQLASDVWTDARAPLLSRIEWLEAEKHSWKTYAKGLYSRIDALSKDAERLDWMILHSATVLHTSDAEHCSVKWGNNQTDLHDSAREAIDAAIGAREWE